MDLIYSFKNKLSLLFAPALILALASCSSYQYSGYEADGIYGEARPGIWEQEQPQNTEVRPNNSNSYYKNLFAQQSQMYGDMLESEVFTDVESYSSNTGYDDYSDVGGDVAYVGGYAPWGNSPDTYTVNIYNNRGFSPWYYGYGYGWGAFGPWDPYFGYGYYPGWGGFGPWGGGYWGSPIAYGGWGYGSYWNIGWGYGPYRGYGWGYGYGGYSRFFGGYGYPYYRNRYYNNNVAYSVGRRGSDQNYRDNRNGVVSRSNRNSSYSRSIRDIRSTDSRSNRSSEYSSTRSRSNTDSDRVYSRTTTRTRSEMPERSSYSRSSESSSRPTYRSSRSSNNSYRTSSPTRSSSSGSVGRSSSSSSRSSGGSSRSSGSSRGRGGR